MNDGPPPNAKAARIHERDRAIEPDPDSIAAQFEHAGLLRERGLFEEAKRRYLELLRREPTHFGALNDFGTLLLRAGYKTAARTVFAKAVAHHPNNPTGHVNLANLLFLVGELGEARRHFETALKIDPEHIHAHRGMGNLLAELGDAAGARRHRDKGFKDHFLTTLPYRGDNPPVKILLLVSALGGNIPTGPILDDRYFQNTTLVTEYADPDLPLPAHDFVFNSIGDADLCRDGLAAARAIVARTDRPVINHPAAVLKTGRLANAERLNGIAGVRTPRMTALPRDLLAGRGAAAAVESRGFAFPLLLRAPGFHTGRHFMRVEHPQDLAAAARALPRETLWVIEFMDARGADGMFRKCRAMIIDGKLYPLHLAISRHWKVHYFRADMADSAEHRAQDAAFLDDMASVVGAHGMAALERICTTLALDYGGIDFAVGREGDILLFEANATMVLIPLSPDPKWDYRRPAFERVFAAVRAMLMDRATASRSGMRRAPSPP